MAERSPNEKSTTPELAVTEIATGDRRTPGALAALGAEGPRYDPKELLGKGGMGEVRLCLDRRIGRDVAVKVAIGGGSHGRFVREALLQARLEHPAFVPVYDVATDDKGEIFFTMRRVRGKTLRSIIREQRDRPEHGMQHRLLSVFAQLCLAVDYAHSRGVVHRDIKPENVMLGDFGEFYLLDWGVAKAAGEAEPEGSARPSQPAMSSPDATADGSVLGTMGYMAPEQLRGEHVTLDGRADVYALGAMLFEILTLQPLHPGPSLGERIDQTLDQAHDRSPASRAPARDIPPELDAICVKATSFDRGDRHATARALSEAVERFLEGDRDVALRKKHAIELAERAEASLRTAGGDAAARIEAGREASRALAFDPSSADARRTLLAVLTETPENVPAEAIAPAERSQSEAAATVIRWYWRTLIGTAITMGALLIASGVIDAPLLVATIGSSLVAAVVLAWASRDARNLSEGAITFGFALLCLSSAMFSRWASPWVAVPMMMTINLIGFTLYGSPRHRTVRALLAGLAIIVPIALDESGAVPTTYHLTETALTIVPRLSGFHPWTPWILMIHAVGTVLSAPIMIATILDRVRAIERRFHAQAWMLRQVVAP